MVEYLILSLYIILISVAFQNKKKQKKLLFILVFVPLILYFGTRIDMGVDYEDYYEQFYNHKDWTFSHYLMIYSGEKFEPGFFFLEKLFPTFNSLIFACTLLYMIPLAIFFYEYIPKKYYALAFVLFLFNPKIFDSIIAMRSSIVVGLFLLAVLLRNRGFRKSAIIVVGLSGTFHLSGYFLFPAFLISDKNLKKHYNFLYVFIISLVVLALLSKTVFGTLLTQLSGYVNELSVYGGHITDTTGGMGFYLFSFVRAGFVLYILSLLRRDIISDKYLWFAWLTIFDYFFYMIQGIDVTYRFAFYFYVVSVVFKCEVLRIDKTIYSKLFISLSLLYLLYSFIGFMQEPQTQIYIWRYESFLFK